MNARELIALLESLPDKALPVELYDRNGVEILRPQTDSVIILGVHPVREIINFTEK